MELANINSNKKWLLGTEGSKCPVEIGYFEKADDRLHYHEKIFEYYLVFSGKMTLLVSTEEFELKAGDVCCVFPEEKHLVVNCSKNLRCFLVKYPHLPEDKRF